MPGCANNKLHPSNSEEINEKISKSDNWHCDIPLTAGIQTVSLETDA